MFLKLHPGLGSSRARLTRVRVVSTNGVLRRGEQWFCLHANSLVHLKAKSRGVEARQQRWHGVHHQTREEATAGDDKSGAADACRSVTIVGAGANVVLCGLKGAAGYVSGSSALLADAFHSLGDLVGDAVTLAAIKYSRDPPDARFPFGKGKFESLGTLAVAGLLIGTACTVGSYAWLDVVAMMSSDSPSSVHVLGSTALICAVLSVVVKEALFRITIRVGEKARSSVTVANAHHHRSDALSSVVAVLGISGNMAGFTFLDPVAGAVVAGMIFKAGAEIGLDALRDLTDQYKPCNPELIDKIQELCNRRGVRLDKEFIKARPMGPYCSLYMTIYVKSTASVSGAASVAAALKSEILIECEEVQTVFITVLPLSADNTSIAKDDTYTSPEKLKNDVYSVLKDVPEISAVTHFTPHYLSGRTTVNLEVIMNTDLVKTIDFASSVARRAELLILKKVPTIQYVDIHLELRSLNRVCQTGEAPWQNSSKESPLPYEQVEVVAEPENLPSTPEGSHAEATTPKTQPVKVVSVETPQNPAQPTGREEKP
ncbi:Metal tolerance protein C1 [Diplonema papillatum]|nr:Metal tolerance protein C1 [Diplonema papillatum]